MHLVSINYWLFIGISNIAWKKVLWMLWEIYLEKGCWVPIPHLYTLVWAMGFWRLLTHMWIWRNSKALVLLGA